MNHNEISVLNIDLFQSGAKHSDFYFNSIKNHLLKSHRHIEKPHRHGFYACMIFTKGNGIHEIDFQKYDVSPGSLFFMSPGQVHSWQLSEDIDGFIFFHSQEFFDLHFVNEKLRQYPFFSSVQYPRKLQLETNNIVEFSNLFIKIGNENSSSALLSENLILSLISQLYIETVRLFSQEKIIGTQNANTSHIQHYQHFEELLELNFIKEKSAFQYARWMNLTTKHLNRITQTVVQKTVSEIIADRTILEAKRMLIYLDEGLVDIAFRLGYEEYSYFARVFRKKTGQTPSAFVKDHKH
ncbi:helix-turn-helix transcriptional regulator [Epilithonimonas sp.]|uniref:AraC family transcriptional regulator n=1 Tax=Epilithonimonas sp. TaxID=2894511 RepID=UPI00289DA8EB|nr:helix-turn-helix transcriptional regulator [Epilithonimonas sp.]